jgi:hypothetical protein
MARCRINERYTGKAVKQRFIHHPQVGDSEKLLFLYL